LEQYEPIIRLVKNPQEIQATDLSTLKQYSKEFPYMQAVRALIAKISGKASDIKNASAYTANRNVLRNFLRTSFDTNVNIPRVGDIGIHPDMVNAFEKLSDTKPLPDDLVIQHIPTLVSDEPTPTENPIIVDTNTLLQDTVSQSPIIDHEVHQYEIPEAYQSATSSYDDSLTELMKSIEESKQMLDKIREQSLQELEAKQPAYQQVISQPSTAPIPEENPLDFSFFDITALIQSQQKND